jgi:hypothetical protein
MNDNPLTLAAAFDSQLLLLRTGVHKSNAYHHMLEIFGSLHATGWLSSGLAAAV